MAISVEEAFDTLAAALKEDSGYAWGWHCNIAMAAVDEGVDRDVANFAARRFLYNTFDVDTMPEAPQPEPVVPEPLISLWEHLNSDDL